MVKEETVKKTVLVTGDVTIDHNIYQGIRDTPDSKEFQGTMVIDSPGGARLLYEIINKVSKAANKKTKEKTAEYTVQFGLKPDTIRKLPLNLHSYAMWSPCPVEKDSGETVWRMVQPMGYGCGGRQKNTYQPKLSKEGESVPNVIVLDDNALGFRFSTTKDAWPKVIKEGRTNALDWIVLKMSSPVAQGDLWRRLSREFWKKLIVITSIDDIRLEEVVVTKGLSWERSAQDLISELMFNARIRELTKCRHLIINFRSEGALWMRKNEGKCEYHLIYDPEKLEGECGEHIKGKAIGYISCLTTGIVNQLIKERDKIDIGNGIMSGLSAMRSLYRAGHGKTRNHKPEFPFVEVANKILETSTEYSIAKVPVTPKGINSPVPYWAIMEGGDGGGGNQHKQLDGLAKRIALFGPRLINNIPFARFGNFFTVDRSEIESMHSIQRLVKDYEAKVNTSRPLSIAVFGPPGSGKSFAIKQLAQAVLGNNASILEFNLSQFSGPDELVCAFHQVRDEVLKGKIPFVFWDEFDSGELKWLQYLLVPMQDGEFREGQISHPIGKCIFVFAGGTSFTMENFVPPDEDTKKSEKFKCIKGPDFVSRLSGYLNVLGPNRRMKYDKEKGCWVEDDDPADICFPIRRALLLRVVLGLNENEKMDIDRGLLTAFLEIDSYKHGARSLETLILLTRHPDSHSMRRSDLPPAEQMSLHVDYQEFMAIINRDLSFKMNCDLLAPVVHEYYRQLCKEKGWSVKYDMEYSALPDEIMADNLAAAARIPEVLSLVGLVVVPEGHRGKAIDKKVLEDNIEILAEAEHNGWMDQKLKSGWNYGETRNDDKKIHNALIPYKDVLEHDKDKDRNSVRSFPDIVKLAGYKIVHS